MPEGTTPSRRPAKSTAKKAALKKMTAAPTDGEIVALASTHPVAETLCMRWGVPYEYAVIDFDQISVEEYSQIRDANNRKRVDRIEEFFLQMKNGALGDFPPLVLTANDLSIVDGNTRAAALAKLIEGAS
jgi:hypothetical protein